VANDFNNVILIGRLTRDAELKYTATGTAVAKFGLAVNRKRKQGDEYIDEVSFIDITAWAKLAENLSQYLTKGKQIGVCGELRQDRWEKDGQNHSKVGVTANAIQLLGGKSDGGQLEQQAPPQKPSASAPEQGEFLDDIIPF